MSQHAALRALINLMKLSMNILKVMLHYFLNPWMAEGLKVGGAEVLVVALEVDHRRGGLWSQPPDADEGIIPCNSKIALK